MRQLINILKLLFGKLLLFYMRKIPVEKRKHLIEKHFSDLLPSKNLKTIYKNNDGISFYIENHDYVMNKIFIRSVYERNTIRMIKPTIVGKSGSPTIIDCGANIGMYSLYFSKWAPQSTIHAFEPLKKNQDLFLRNCELNNFKNIKLNCFGLSNEEKEVDIYIVDESNLGKTSTFSQNKGEKRERIKLTTLDKYCAENNIEEIDFIKVDIEGSELDFIKGAENMISKSKNLKMLVEINECTYKAYSTPEGLYKYIMSFGFRSYTEREYPFSKKEIFQNSNFRGNILFVK
jgi:FkbM family methyltransferase